MTVNLPEKTGERAMRFSLGGKDNEFLWCYSYIEGVTGADWEELKTDEFYIPVYESQILERKRNSVILFIDKTIVELFRWLVNNNGMWTDKLEIRILKRGLKDLSHKFFYISTDSLLNKTEFLVTKSGIIIDVKTA